MMPIQLVHDNATALGTQIRPLASGTPSGLPLYYDGATCPTLSTFLNNYAYMLPSVFPITLRATKQDGSDRCTPVTISSASDPMVHYAEGSGGAAGYKYVVQPWSVGDCAL